MSTEFDNLERRLAERIRIERERRGWSLADLSNRSGVSRAMISKIEREESSPTAALLGRLSAAFGVTLSQLLASAEGGGGRLARLAEQERWTDPATGFQRRALTPPVPGGGPLELVWGDLPAGAEVAYPAAAYRMIGDQQILVVEGTLHFHQGTALYAMAPGDCLRLGPPEDCVFANPGPGPCRYVVAIVRRDP
ncbi:transcriptional regulator with XRE-family HTH domain [Azospirillum agricola]|uniref:helix-turn-helix domain-containing protein n=1 Tax=Azospirillum agricola TaxID=1720247 RepID=UPI001AE4C3C2|nr:XRE family transcriptional regulator [Azospirillum agricola]MBP2232208.1 transcriptional regulator with XRE-family HTH domain [Azospirillum agricola]